MISKFIPLLLFPIFVIATQPTSADAYAELLKNANSAEFHFTNQSPTPLMLTFLFTNTTTNIKQPLGSSFKVPANTTITHTLYSMPEDQLPILKIQTTPEAPAKSLKISSSTLDHSKYLQLDHSPRIKVTTSLSTRSHSLQPHLYLLFENAPL